MEKIRKLVQVERVDNEDFFKDLKAVGKKAIPLLINVIDTDSLGFVGFQDFNSSTLHLFHHDYVGIRAAYIIEYILADTNSIRLYEFGVIVKKNESGKLEMKSLSFKDVKAIKGIYEEWWRKNKNESMKELSNSWKARKRVLDGSDFVWQ
ncbi:MAG: hypothetical protein ACSLE0_21005 [Chitinophagaceae bacterium]